MTAKLFTSATSATVIVDWAVAAVAAVTSLAGFLVPLASLIAAVASILAIFRVREMHVLINSRMTELLEATRRGERAAGNLEGQAEERRTQKLRDAEME